MGTDLKQSTQQAALFERAPIVTIMGHVDHGKTTLLDAIRETRVAQREHGGITQHIGAYQVEHQGNTITFIDTPGHAAFSHMRERGADVTDIVVLVVAANDGIKPQTIESIQHIKAAGVQYLVAINKMDVPGASADMVKAQLTEHEVFVEGYGGQVPAVAISALKKTGIDDLLEMIVLMAEIEELEAQPDAPLDAVVIESHMDHRRGPIMTVIVRNGSIRPGDTVYIFEEEHKVKALFNDLGETVKQAVPGMPVEVMGFKTVPDVGSVMRSEPMTPEAAEEVIAETQSPVDDDEDEKPRLKLILKADTAGTLEAIRYSITQEEVVFVDTGVGPVTESDVLKAQAVDALILAFNVHVPKPAKRLAEIENVEIESYKIIYKLLEEIEKKLLKLIEPTIDEVETGQAVVQAVFSIRGDAIAGCKIKSGSLKKGDLVHVWREELSVHDATISSLKQGKVDLPEAESGSECGVIVTPQFDFKVGDVIKSYKI